MVDFYNGSFILACIFNVKLTQTLKSYTWKYHFQWPLMTSEAIQKCFLRVTVAHVHLEMYFRLKISVLLQSKYVKGPLPWLAFEVIEDSLNQVPKLMLATY